MNKKKTHRVGYYYLGFSETGNKPQRFSTSSCHNDEAVPSYQQVVDDILLHVSKGVVSIVFLRPTEVPNQLISITGRRKSRNPSPKEPGTAGITNENKRKNLEYGKRHFLGLPINEQE